MKRMQVLTVILGVILSAGSQAASPYVGQVKAGEVCAQCHGLKMPAAGSPFPALAGRDANYLKTALKQYRDKTRINEIMNNVAGSLTDNDINDIISYYSSVKP